MRRGATLTEVLAIVTIAAVAGFCILMIFTPGCRQKFSHVKSFYVGLEREVILYDANGKVLRTWTGKLQVEDKGGTCRFLKEDGKAVTVSGTFVIEEK